MRLFNRRRKPEGKHFRPKDYHEDYEKHLELGLTVDDLDNEDPIFVNDENDINEIWANYTDIERYKADIELLAKIASESD